LSRDVRAQCGVDRASTSDMLRSGPQSAVATEPQSAEPWSGSSRTPRQGMLCVNNLLALGVGSVMHIWFAAFCGLVLCGCSAPRDVYSLKPANNQQAVVRDGVPALVSSRKHVVLLRPLASHQVSYDRPRFVVALLNRGKGAAALKVSDIAVETSQPRRVKMPSSRSDSLMGASKRTGTPGRVDRL
jgi:hypothetical protein